MRLLEHNDGEFSLTEDFGKETRFAMLSHVWGAEEVTFRDLIDGTGKIYRLVVASSGKEFYGFVVRISTAERVLTVRAFQNRSLRIVYFSLLLC